LTSTEVTADHEARPELSQQSNIPLGCVSDHYVYLPFVIRERAAKWAPVTGLLKPHSENEEIVDGDSLAGDFSAARDRVYTLRVIVIFKVVVVISLYDEYCRHPPCVAKKVIELVDVASFSCGEESRSALITTFQCPHALRKII
jgi:hypothetical protein